MNQMLFEKGSSEPPSAAEVAEAAALAGTPRLRVPHRIQIEMHCASLDELLAADHRVRLVWAAVSGLRLDRWLRKIKAVEGNVGRDATDPRLLVALWVYATVEGIGSARGGDHWDELLTQIVGSLLAEGLVSLTRVAQDGMRVRASAGKDTFRRRVRLESCLEEAREQVRALKQLADESPAELSQRQRAARERAAREREQRLQEAIRNCEALQTQREATAKKSGRKPTEARASMTDPEARVMQFSDGGYRPGYNVQFSTTTETGIIVGVDVVNAGVDSDQLPPMLEQLKQRYQQVPQEALVDGGFASCDAIEKATAAGCTVYAPLKEEQMQLDAGKDPSAKKPGDSLPLATWRARGNRRVQDHLSPPLPDGRVGQRDGPQSRLDADARAEPKEMSDGRRAVCDHP